MNHRLASLAILLVAVGSCGLYFIPLTAADNAPHGPTYDNQPYTLYVVLVDNHTLKAVTGTVTVMLLNGTGSGAVSEGQTNGNGVISLKVEGGNSILLVTADKYAPQIHLITVTGNYAYIYQLQPVLSS